MFVALPAVVLSACTAPHPVPAVSGGPTAEPRPEAGDGPAERADPANAVPSNSEGSTKSGPPSISRPPPPDVPPVEHAGIRYSQDTTDERRGDQRGGYLAADDPRTGARLWRLKVYDVADHRAAGVESGGIYFRSMRVVGNGAALEIENEVGGVYRVDLASRRVTKIGGPPDDAPPAAPLPTKPVPQ